MKKSLLVIMLALFSMGTYAQVSWNAKAGMNISNWSGNYGVNQSTSSKLGFKMGVGMEYSFNNTWSIQPSLLLSTKGMKVTDVPMLKANYEITDFSLTVNQMYIEMPINAQARFALCNYMNIVVSAGPYFAYGIGGKSTAKTTFENGSSVELNSQTFGNEISEDGLSDLNLNKFDFGVGGGVALEFGKLSLGMETQFGLTNLMKGDNSSESIKNTNFGLTLGYKF